MVEQLSFISIVISKAHTANIAISVYAKSKINTLKMLEYENNELKQVNKTICKVASFFAHTKLNYPLN